MTKLLDVARTLEPVTREHEDALEAEPVEWLTMIEEISRVNASAGWTAFIQSGVGLTFLTPGQFERFRVRGGGRMILAMNLGRIGGKAARLPGGWQVTGRWPFASGSPFATWLGGMSFAVDEDGAPVMDAAGQPRRLLAIWPADQARIIDTWDGLGLRGTGSGDFSVSDIFVPDEQVNSSYSATLYDRPLFRLKEMPEMGHGAHSLGIASSAAEAFVSAVNSKPVPGSARHTAMGHMQAHQIAFGRADALVRAARSLLHETVREAYEYAASHAELSPELRVRLGRVVFPDPRVGERTGDRRPAIPVSRAGLAVEPRSVR